MVGKGGCLKSYLSEIMELTRSEEMTEKGTSADQGYWSRTGCGTPSCACVASPQDSSYMCVCF